MYYSVNTSTETKIYEIDFSEEEWKRIPDKKRSENTQKAASLIITGMMGIIAALYGGVDGPLKWILLAAGILFFGAGIFKLIKKTDVGIDRNGNVADQAALNQYISKMLRDYYNIRDNNVSIELCPENGVDPETNSIDIIKVPFSAILPSVFKRKFINGRPYIVPIEEKPVHVGKLILFTIPFIMVGIALYGIWQDNIADGFIRVLFTIASVLLVILILIAHPSTKHGRAKLTVFFIFLFIQTFMLAYTNYMLPKYLDFAYHKDDTIQTESKNTVFIVRENQNSSKVIYAKIGKPSQYVAYAIAGEDYSYDTASYGRSNIAAAAFSCDCEIYDANTLDSLATINTKAYFPQTISGSDKTEFHPTNDNIIANVLEWFKLHGSVQ